jgi:hypothetical protein
MGAYDSVNHIIYSANWDGGAWKLQTGAAPAPASTPVPATSTPVPATRTPVPTATAVPTTRKYTSTATAPTTVVTAGSSVNLSASVTSATADTSLVDMEVYDTAGRKIFQKFWDSQTFAAGQTRSYSATTGALAAGTYTVKIGIFAPGWASLYQWNDAAQVQVVKPAPPAWSASAAATPTSLTAGTSVTIAASATSSTAATAVVDVEVYGPSGTRAYQTFFDNQAFAAGQRRDYPWPGNCPRTRRQERTR